MARRIAGIALLTVLVTTVSATAEVAGWRTDGVGAYPQVEPPADWTDPDSLLWTAPMPSWCNGTPVVHGDLVFTLAEIDTLLCLDANTGDIRWQQRTTLQDALGEGPNFTEAEMTVFRQKQAERDELQNRARSMRRDARNDPAVQAQVDQLNQQVRELNEVLAPLDKFSPPDTHKTNGYTSATPVTDGKSVYVVLGTGVVAAYDVAGKRLWAQYVQQPPHRWGHSASPVLVGDTLVVQFQDLIGLSAADGSERWRVKGQASFGSPIAATVGDAPAVITPTGLFVDPTDGKVLGKADNVKLEYNSPLFVDGVVYFIYDNAVSLKVQRNADGTIATEQVWSQRLPDDRYYASPVLHDGLLYAVTRGEEVCILRADDGAIEHTGKLPGGGDGNSNSAYPSPVLIGDHVYFGTESGRVCVYEPGASGNVVKQMQLDSFRSTPVVASDRIYLRTMKSLVCLYKAQQTARAD